jgi:hypothetical protein
LQLDAFSFSSSYIFLLYLTLLEGGLLPVFLFFPPFYRKNHRDKKKAVTKDFVTAFKLSDKGPGDQALT